jgi:hypothetical protein
MNINKEFVGKKIKREENCFLIDICQYKIDIYKKNNSFSDQCVRKNLKLQSICRI